MSVYALPILAALVYLALVTLACIPAAIREIRNPEQETR